MQHRHSVRGFTLVELMIVMVVVAILASIAYPSYLKYVAKANRRAAQSEMMEIANRQQQILFSNRIYFNKAGLESAGYVIPPEVSRTYDYDVVVGTGSAPSFTITFTPKGSQLVDGTEALTLNEQGVKTPTGKWNP